MNDTTERGHAMLEVLTVGLVLLIPLIWLLTTLSRVHLAALAVTSAAREAALDASRATDVSDARTALDRAVVQALTSHGLDPNVASISASYRSLDRGSPVEVVLSYPVPILSIPFLGGPSTPSVSISGSHTANVPRFGDR